MRDTRLQAYLEERCGPVPDYLYTVARRTHWRTVQPQMLCGHAQGRLLAWLVEWLQPKRVLEVGTFTGYSALCFAERLPPGGSVHTIEINDEREQLIRDNFALTGFAERLLLCIGDANELIPTLPAPWDLVYLDARKEDYARQFALVADRLSERGVILLDNVLWDGRVLDEQEGGPTAQALRDLTFELARDSRFESLVLPLGDGLQVLRRRPS